MSHGQTQAPNMDQFEAYFRRADLDHDGRISGNEAVSFFQAANLPRPVLAQIWTIADQNRTGFLGRQEFFNALKLVTVAQTKRELTPVIVNSALYGEASAKIPPPRIDLTPTPGPQANMTVGSSIPAANAASASQNTARPPMPNATFQPPQGVGGPRMPNATFQPPQGIGGPRMPNAPFQSPQGANGPRMPNATFQSPQGANGPRIPQANFQPFHGVNGPRMAQPGITNMISQPPNPPALVGGNPVVPQPGQNSQPIRSVAPVGQDVLSMVPSGFPTSAPSQTTPMQPALPKPSDASINNKVVEKDSKALTVSGNGHASDSLFGDVFSATPAQPKQDSVNTTSGSTSSSMPSAVASLGVQPTVKSTPFNSSVQFTPAHHPTDNHNQQGHLLVKPNPQVPVQASSGLPAGVPNSFTGQPQAPWPRMSQPDIQKYSRVFMQVDTDRDGKITGEQARNLFLSWRLPREALMQVWDLSDQDKDSMLSLKEFCVALYLMERFREGRPLPSVLPSGIMPDGSVSSQNVAPPENVAWRASPAYQQPQTNKAVKPAASLGRPPRPGPIPLADDAMQSTHQQKPKVPVLEKNLLDQLSTDEQSSLNSKFREATDAEKKVAELEKEILDAREKVQFYHSKMQELILYKSRCDNRLNEITERVYADKREVESLGKKYEEKYRQTGDVASKLTIEEATFRDIQEKKMELYRAIVKVDQGGSEGAEERVNNIQLELEDLVKELNERCKTYGLRAKPTSLVELPFGWQPGIQEGAADWDENWDSFEDEGFLIVKDLTLDVQNVTAPPKPKSSLKDIEISRDGNMGAKSVADVDEKSEKGHKISDDDRVNTPGEETASTPPESPVYNESEDSHSKKELNFDGSPHANHSEHDGHESRFYGAFDEPGSGTFDSQYDANGTGTSDFSHSKKDALSDDSLFGFDDWGLNPIRTGSSHTESTYQKQGPFFDSVPSTPLTENIHQKQGSFFDSVPSTPLNENIYQKQGPFFDSVPSTPSYNVGSTPLGESLFQRNSPFAFADSVPSTPLYSSNNSPRRYSEGTEEHSFDSFSRFDSFSMQDGGLFAPQEPTPFARFDSFRSNKDSEYDQGISGSRDSLTRFDSFRSMADSDYNFGAPPREQQFSIYDSVRSSTGEADFGNRYSSFDDADPFGSNDPFKTSLESETPRRDSDSWNDHFQVSFDSQTPRRDSDIWNDPFKGPFESQTSRRDSGSSNAF